MGVPVQVVLDVPPDIAAGLASGTLVRVGGVVRNATTGAIVVIVMGGVAGGIEKFTTIAMPALFVMLVIVIIRSNTLPGATKGLEFMFSPDFSVFKGFPVC